MITASHIQELLTAKPFRPFTLDQGMTDSFTVEDPAHARLTHEILILTIPGRKRPANPKFRFPASVEEEFAREHESTSP